MATTAPAAGPSSVRSVYVGRQLLVDVAATTLWNIPIVEGTLAFNDTRNKNPVNEHRGTREVNAKQIAGTIAGNLSYSVHQYYDLLGHHYTAAFGAATVTSNYGGATGAYLHRWDSGSTDLPLYTIYAFNGLYWVRYINQYLNTLVENIPADETPATTDVSWMGPAGEPVLAPATVAVIEANYAIVSLGATEVSITPSGGSAAVLPILQGASVSYNNNITHKYTQRRSTSPYLSRIGSATGDGQFQAHFPSYGANTTVVGTVTAGAAAQNITPVSLAGIAPSAFARVRNADGSNEETVRILDVTDPTWTIVIAGGAGTFTVTYNGDTTGAIAFDATIGAVQTALEGLDTLNAGDVVVTGTPSNYTVTLDPPFTGTLTAAGAGGATPTVAQTGTFSAIFTSNKTANWLFNIASFSRHDRENTEVGQIQWDSRDLNTSIGTGSPTNPQKRVIALRPFLGTVTEPDEEGWPSQQVPFTLGMSASTSRILAVELVNMEPAATYAGS